MGTTILEWKNTSDVDNAVLEISHGQFQFTCSQTDLKYILKFPTITTHFNTV